MTQMLPMVLLAISDDEERRFMTALYLDHHRLMRYTAQRYLSQPADVEDAVSDAVVALHGKLPTLRELSGRSLRAYIVTTVRNTALNALARQQREQQRQSPMGEAVIPTLADRVDVEKQVELENDLERVLKALRSLPGKEQEVLWQHIAQSRPHEEIAAATGLSPESIRKYLSRGRAKVRAAVYGEEAERR